MPNDFVVSWERAWNIISAVDPGPSLPVNPAIVLPAIIPGAGARRSDRTSVSTLELGIAFNTPIQAAASLTPGVVATQATLRATTNPTVGPPNGDGQVPLYLARVFPVPANQGLLLIGSIAAVVESMIATIIAPPFLGTIPPAATLAPLVLVAWNGTPFAAFSNLLNAAVTRYIAAAFHGGEG